MTEDQAMTQLIDERDAAESAMSRAYEMVMGESPQWSNMFSYADALDQMRWKLNVGAGARASRYALADMTR